MFVNCPIDCRYNGFALRECCRLFSRRELFKCAVTVERAKSDVRDRFVCAHEKNVENRQHAIEVLLLQIDLHVFGDEYVVFLVMTSLHFPDFPARRRDSEYATDRAGVPLILSHKTRTPRRSGKIDRLTKNPGR